MNNEEFLNDVWDIVCETFIGDWEISEWAADIEVARRDGYIHFRELGEKKMHAITKEDLPRGLDLLVQLARQKDFSWSEYAIEAVDGQDATEFDSDQASFMAQLMVFKEVVYG